MNKDILLSWSVVSFIALNAVMLTIGIEGGITSNNQLALNRVGYLCFFGVLFFMGMIVGWAFETFSGRIISSSNSQYHEENNIKSTKEVKESKRKFAG